MKKSLVVVSVLSIAVIIFGGLSYLFTGRIVPSSSCGSDFNNQFNQAVASNNLNFCSTFNGQVDYSKEPVYATYYCSIPGVDVVGTIHRDDFKNSCLQAMGVSTGNVEACRLMSTDKRDQCLLFVSRKAGNDKGCALITDETLKAQCLIGESTNANDSIAACNAITDQGNRNACIAVYSKNVGDKQYCNLITDQEVKDFCLK